MIFINPRSDNHLRNYHFFWVDKSLSTDIKVINNISLFSMGAMLLTIGDIGGIVDNHHLNFLFITIY
jgi:hypothetical protein